MPKSMPKDKKKAQFIDNQLQNKCKVLITTDDKLKIAKQTKLSVGYIDRVIAGTRYNEQIIKSLEKAVANKIKTLNK